MQVLAGGVLNLSGCGNRAHRKKLSIWVMENNDSYIIGELLVEESSS